VLDAINIATADSARPERRTERLTYSSFIRQQLSAGTLAANQSIAVNSVLWTPKCNRFVDLEYYLSGAFALLQMTITMIRRNVAHCNECQRQATFRVRIRNATDASLCIRCAVKVVVRLVELIATREARSSSLKTGRRRKPLLRKL